MHVLGVRWQRSFLNQVLLAFIFIGLIIRCTHVEEFFMTRVIVEECKEAAERIWVLRVELFSIELTLLSVRHVMKLFYVSKQSCLVDTFNIL